MHAPASLGLANHASGAWAANRYRQGSQQRTRRQASMGWCQRVRIGLLGHPLRLQTVLQSL
jgi:hypothetical protein